MTSLAFLWGHSKSAWHYKLADSELPLVIPAIHCAVSEEPRCSDHERDENEICVIIQKTFVLISFSTPTAPPSIRIILKYVLKRFENISFIYQ
jgi:hypothetical protein